MSTAQLLPSHAMHKFQSSGSNSVFTSGVVG